MTQSPSKPRPSPFRARRVTQETLQVEAFEPDQVRPWRFHDRRGSGMDDEMFGMASAVEIAGVAGAMVTSRLPLSPWTGAGFLG